MGPTPDHHVSGIRGNHLGCSAHGTQWTQNYEFEQQRGRLEQELKDLSDQNGDDVAERRWREHQIRSIDNVLKTLKSAED